MSADCGENKFEPKKFEQDIGKLGEKMGMGQECVKNSKNEFSSWQASGKASVLGGLGGSVSMGASGLSSKDEKFEKGCGNFLMNASNIHNLTNNVKCTLNNNTSEVQVSSNTSTKIIVKTRVSPEVQKSLTKEYHETMREFMKLAMNQNFGKEQKESMANSKKQITSAYKAAMGSLTMKNTNLKNEIKTTIKVLKVDELKNNQDLVEDFKKVANAAAHAKLSETAGTNALSANTKQLITQNINNNEQNVTKNIQNILNNTKVEQTSEGLIEIISSSALELSNTTVEQDITVSVAAEAIQSSAIDMGLRTATEMTSGAAASSDTTTKSAGLNDLAKELAKGNTDAIGTVMEGGSSMSKLIMVAGAVVVGLALVASFGKMGGNKRNYMPLPPFPPKGLPPPPPKAFPPPPLPKALPLPPKAFPPPPPKAFPPPPPKALPPPPPKALPPPPKALPPPPKALPPSLPSKGFVPKSY
mgnify:CR=1 FL=1